MLRSKVIEYCSMQLRQTFEQHSLVLSSSNKTWPLSKNSSIVVSRCIVVKIEGTAQNIVVSKKFIEEVVCDVIDKCELLSVFQRNSRTAVERGQTAYERISKKSTVKALRKAYLFD